MKVMTIIEQDSMTKHKEQIAVEAPKFMDFVRSMWFSTREKKDTKGAYGLGMTEESVELEETYLKFSFAPNLRAAQEAQTEFDDEASDVVHYFFGLVAVYNLDVQDIIELGMKYVQSNLALRNTEVFDKLIRVSAKIGGRIKKNAYHGKDDTETVVMLQAMMPKLFGLIVLALRTRNVSVTYAMSRNVEKLRARHGKAFSTAFYQSGQNQGESNAQS